MRRSILLVLLLALCGCGARDAVVKRPTPSPCPAGTAPLRVKDIVGDPAPGWELWKGDQKAIREYALGFRTEVGDAWRGYDAAALIRDGEDVGTAVIVFNVNEQATSDELIAGMEYGADEADIQLEKITIAGREGRLGKTIDDAYVGMAPSRTCSVLVLLSLTKKQLIDAAATLPEE